MPAPISSNKPANTWLPLLPLPPKVEAVDETRSKDEAASVPAPAPAPAPADDNGQEGAALLSRPPRSTTTELNIRQRLDEQDAATQKKIRFFLQKTEREWSQHAAVFESVFKNAFQSDVLEDELLAWNKNFSMWMGNFRGSHTLVDELTRQLSPTQAILAKREINDQRDKQAALETLVAPLTTFCQGAACMSAASYVSTLIHDARKEELEDTRAGQEESGMTVNHGVDFLEKTIASLIEYRLSGKPIQELFPGNGLLLDAYMEISDGRVKCDSVKNSDELLLASSFFLAWIQGKKMHLNQLEAGAQGNAVPDELASEVRDDIAAADRMLEKQGSGSIKRCKAALRLIGQLDRHDSSISRSAILATMEALKKPLAALEAAGLASHGIALRSKIDVCHERMSAHRIEDVLLCLKKFQLATMFETDSAHKAYLEQFEGIELELKILKQCFVKLWSDHDTKAYEEWRVPLLEKIQARLDSFLDQHERSVAAGPGLSEVAGSAVTGSYANQRAACLHSLIDALRNLQTTVAEEIEWGYGSAPVISKEAKEEAKQFFESRMLEQTTNWLDGAKAPDMTTPAAGKAKKSSVSRASAARQSVEPQKAAEAEASATSMSNVDSGKAEANESSIALFISLKEQQQKLHRYVNSCHNNSANTTLSFSRRADWARGESSYLTELSAILQQTIELFTSGSITAAQLPQDLESLPGAQPGQQKTDIQLIEHYGSAYVNCARESLAAQKNEMELRRADSVQSCVMHPTFAKLGDLMSQRESNIDRVTRVPGFTLGPVKSTGVPRPESERHRVEGVRIRLKGEDKTVIVHQKFDLKGHLVHMALKRHDDEHLGSYFDEDDHLVKIHHGRVPLGSHAERLVDDLNRYLEPQDRLSTRLH